MILSCWGESREIARVESWGGFTSLMAMTPPALSLLTGI